MAERVRRPSAIPRPRQREPQRTGMPCPTMLPSNSPPSCIGEAASAALIGMRSDPWRQVPHGLRPPLPRGTAGARRARRGFRIDETAVTNAEFAAFVAATAYVTVAERPLDPALYPGARPEMLGPGSLVFRMTDGPVDTSRLPQLVGLDAGCVLAAPGGTRQRHRGPRGPPGRPGRLRGRRGLRHLGRQGAADRGRVGVRRARRARRRGVRLGRRADARAARTWPTPGRARFPGGTSRRMASPAPARSGCFPPNGYGLFEMCGNVWEWTTDWFAAAPRASDPAKPAAAAAHAARPAHGGSFDPAQPAIRIPRKVVKGGSFLCAPSYCRRYRPAARHAQMVDTGMSHIGFRCVRRDIPQPQETRVSMSNGSNGRSRRDMLLGGAAGAGGGRRRRHADGAGAAAARRRRRSAPARRRPRQQRRAAEHPGHLGRRHRRLQHQRLQPRA